MQQDFIEVSKDEFYKIIGPQDAVLSVIGDYPYTALFKLRNNRKLIGKSISSYEDECLFPIVTRYYVSSDLRSVE